VRGRKVVAVMRRGVVWVTRLNPNQGAEVDKVSQAVVIQADAPTEAGLAILLVVPIPGRARLLRGCWAMAEQPRGVDRNRVDEGPLTR
jgi:mRNA interferase MazF